MKILIINEPFVKDFCRTQRWAAKTRGRVLRAPDWLAYAAAVIERDIKDCEVKLFDFPAMGWDKKELRNLIKSEKPDFVVLDSTTPSIYSDIECAQIVKQESNAKVIMVGPHISIFPKETIMEAGGAVDVACIGEYDYTVRDVIEGYKKLGNVKGICYLENGSPLVTPLREPISNLDEIPFPAWHHLDLMKYFDGGKLYPYIDIISGRGCPNQCVFCLWPQVMHGKNYRFRSSKNVVDEIEYDIKLCPDVLKGGEFFFEDDTFTVNTERAVGICEEILRRGHKITFSVNARADNCDRRMFEIMRKAGCRELLVGYESGVQEILDKSHKKLKIEQAQEFTRTAKEFGFDVHGCFVIGLPGETEETAKKTLDYAMNLGLTTLQFSGAVPFPGTDFYNMCVDKGWLKATKWSQWLDSGEQSPVVEYPGISGERIKHYVDYGLKKFYLRPGYMLNFLFRTRGLPDLYRKIRGAFNFLSYLFADYKKC
ncbi:MAG: radical SAM protein [Elusimicrobia bacterium]|nr:radical SAM protein [Candidatus Liberimonas magnetica]